MKFKTIRDAHTSWLKVWQQIPARQPAEPAGQESLQPVRSRSAGVPESWSHGVMESFLKSSLRLAISGWPENV